MSVDRHDFVSRLRHEADDGWEQREDVLAGLRRDLIAQLAGDPKTLPLVTDGTFIEEAIQVIAQRSESGT